MKKITFISALFLCMSLQMQASPVQTVTNPTQAKKGELPPAWVKNKVSYEQYAQLVEANKQRGIDYSALKGYGVSDKFIETFVKTVTTTNSTNIAVFTSAKCLSPVEVKDIEGGKQYSYTIYSSTDGYDAHLTLTMQVKDGQEGADYQIIPFSISGMPVKAHVRLSGIDDKYQAKSVVQSKNKSDKACYALLGTITYTDPLGYEHQENINLCSIRLMAE